jgi:spore germination protein PF
MPYFIGKVHVQEISGGEVKFGNTLKHSPVSSTKSTTGSGSGSTGPFQIILNGISVTQNT